MKAGTKLLTALPTAALLLAAPIAYGQSAGQFDVDTRADTVDASPGDGACADAGGRCSLRAAVQEANASAGADGINLQGGGRYELRRAGAGEDAAATGDLDVTSEIEIDGNGAVVDANGFDRAFDVLAGGSFVVNDLVVVGGRPPNGESGGAFRSAGQLTIRDSRIAQNAVDGTGASGGGIFNDQGDLSVESTTIEANSARRAGGGIEANIGTTALDDVELSRNSTGPAPGNGGGLHVTGDGDVTIDDSVVFRNVASAEGGGLWSSATGTMTVSNTRIVENRAGGDAADQGGGGLFSDGGSVVVRDSQVLRNSATGSSGSGGGILNNQGDLSVESTTIEANSARRAGGGIEANIGTTALDDVELSRNNTGPNPGNGGGLHLTGAGAVTVDDSVVFRNTASDEGGGLWSSATGTMTVSGTRVVENRADGDDADQGGGGLFSDGGTLVVSGSQVLRNSATGSSGSGGGILNNQGDLSVESTTIEANSARRAGGGIEANIGTTALDDVELSRNSTGPNPGNGGGLHLTGAGQVTIDDSVVFRNVADFEGGGLWNSSTGTMTVTNTDIRENRAPIDPNVHNDGGTFTIDGQPVPTS